MTTRMERLKQFALWLAINLLAGAALTGLLMGKGGFVR